MPAREVDVAARALLSRRRLREERRGQAKSRGHLLDRELGVDRIVGGLQRGTRREIELEQTRSGLRVDGGELDSQSLEGRAQPGHESVESAQLGEAVADDAGRKPAGLAVADADLVLDGREYVVAQLRHLRHRSTED